jgi:uncharacterized membrane protein
VEIRRVIMSIKNLNTKLMALMVILIAVVNLVAYQYLPEKVGLQIKASGQLNNFVSKPMFLLSSPLLLLISYLYLKFVVKDESPKNVIIGIIILFGNTILIYFNLIS